MRRKQHRRRIGRTKVKLPHLLFTLDQLVFLRKTLEMLERVMMNRTQPLVNKQFALETVMLLQAKIQQIIRLGLWGEALTLDSNEIILLQTSIWIYAATLPPAPSAPSVEVERVKCLAINLLLAPVTKQTGIT